MAPSLPPSAFPQPRSEPKRLLPRTAASAPRPSGSPSGCRLPAALPDAPAPSRSSRPQRSRCSFPESNPWCPSSGSGRELLRAAAAPTGAAPGVPGRCRAHLPGRGCPDGPQTPASPGRRRAANPGERSREGRAGYFLSALTSLSLGDPRLNLHRKAETNCCPRLLPPRPAEIQAGPFEVNQRTAEAPPPMRRDSCALPGEPPGSPGTGSARPVRPPARTRLLPGSGPWLAVTGWRQQAGGRRNSAPCRAHRHRPRSVPASVAPGSRSEIFLGATRWSLNERRRLNPRRRLASSCRRRPAARWLSAVQRGASPEPLPPRPAAPFLPRQLSAAGRMRRAKQIVKDFGGRSQAAIRN